jgi:hypothetical protein
VNVARTGVRNGAGNIVTTRLAAHVRCSGVVSAGARRPRRALKGNKAQEGQGVRQPATGAERYGLDCGAKPRRRRSRRKPGETRRWKRRFEQPRRKLRANVREATATATWCGCSRGRSFEGCESRRGKGGLRLGVRSSRTVRTRRRRRKRDEPQDRQRDATSPRTVRRRKPPRWRKTTRAEHAARVAPSLPKQSRKALREWTPAAMSMKGKTSDG